ncbi:hypothetical protein KJ567_04440 [Candidatus Bipolaricaulota bacterium]|nr:hypothetical protein [Candidatus Bipolaricaulota bacterium]
MVDRPGTGLMSTARAGGILVAVLLSLLVALPYVASSQQEEPFTQRVLGTLITLPDEHLPALMQLVGILDIDEEARLGLLELPREFLANQELVAPISLPSDEFQITILDFSVPLDEIEGPWFGVAEPLDELAFDLKGVGVFYGTIGVFIQEAVEMDSPVARGAAEPVFEQQKEDMLRFISERLAGDTLERLREVMKDLERMDPMDSQRLAFLENPREYLLGHELTLPASRYRIVALDFDRAAAVGTVHAAEIRAGLAVVPEGIGVFSETIGIYVQQAI